MASQVLFNRVVRFRVFTRELQGSNDSPERRRITDFTSGFLFEYTKHYIVARFEKSHSTDVRSAGSVSVTNIDRSEINVLVSPNDAKQIFYSFEAGYGDETDLKIVSEGRVGKITFRHEGSDTHVDFSVSEAHPGESSWAQELGPNFFPKDTSLSSILQTFKNRGVPIRIDNRGNLESDLASKKLATSLQMTKDIQSEVNNLMAQYGYTAAIIDRELVITQENSIPKSEFIDLRQLRVRGHNPDLIKLNFNTGLLTASLDTIYDLGYVKAYHYLSFSTLWIAELAPLSFIELNEPSRYQPLHGVYRVKSTSINLDNFTGNFMISGSALHISSEEHKKDFVDIRIPDHIRRRATTIENTIEEQRKNLSRFGIRLPF